MPRTPEVELAGAACQRIIAAAREHFLVHGFHSVTMTDLAQEMRVSKKTIYAHFASKNALLEAMLLDNFRRAEEEMQAITSECAADFVTGLHRLLACVQRHAQEIRPPLLRDIRRDAPELFKVVQLRRRELIQRYFSKVLGEGRREGLIRKDVRVELIIEILLGAADSVVNPVQLAKQGLSPARAMQAVISVVLEGALTSAGRKKI